jgi:hypothetical protein
LGVHDGAAGTHEYEEERSEQLGEEPPPLLPWIVERAQPGILESEQRLSSGWNALAVALPVDHYVHPLKVTAGTGVTIAVTVSTHIVRTG